MPDRPQPLPSADRLAASAAPPRRRSPDRRWGTPASPLPRANVFAKPHDPDAPTVDLGERLTKVIEDIAARCPTFAHLRPAELLVTFTAARNRRRHGLLARVTPMRFRGGAPTQRFRGTVYQVQRFTVDGRDVLYLVTFCLPRFLDQSYEQKLVTIFHELYHIGPDFDGDLRRHPGRYDVHTKSKREYDEAMLRLVVEYLRGHPDPRVLAFLHRTSAELRRAPLNLVGTVVPRPKMVPVAPAPSRPA
jgi:hypothetical protein